MKTLLLSLMAAATTSISATAALVEKAVEYKEGETTLEGFHVYDDAVKGKRPAVLIIHQWTGLSDYVKGRARQLADAGEALVVVLLDAGALDVDLLLCLVRAIILFEKLLHVHSGDVELALLGDGHGGERCRHRDGEKTTNKGHLVGKLGFQKADYVASMNKIPEPSTFIPVCSGADFLI